VTRKRAITAFVVLAVATTVGVVAHRLWKYEAEEPLRAGVSLLKAGDHEGARKALLPFAERGNPVAQRLLGQIYAEGLGVPADDVRAEMWFRRAECGCKNPGNAEFYTGRDLLRKIPPDQAGAVRWIIRAAEAGHPEAQALLADRERLSSEGLVVDSATSAYWSGILHAD
jgi:uncharacterized protein